VVVPRRARQRRVQHLHDLGRFAHQSASVRPARACAA
jgi:hypothetical protein